MLFRIIRTQFRNKRILNSLNSIKSRSKHQMIEKLNECQKISDLNGFVTRTHTCDQLSDENIGQTVKLCGWVQYQRMGKFLTLKDSYGSTQIIVINDKKTQKTVSKLRPESVIEIKGQVVRRPEKEINPKMNTGSIEVVAEEINVLSNCRNDIPFIPRDYNNSTEQTRLKYRYLDLRHPQIQTNLRIRSKVIHKMRQFLADSCGFVEVETPTLFKATPGGAKEFVVPTQTPNCFYNLVQSPQQFKQLLMVGGIDRYFQIARCYRDEGTKPDRQPEFTQLDLEISFTTEEGVMSLIEELLRFCWPQTQQISLPFRRMTYSDAIRDYGTDKPDLRTNENQLAFVWIIDFPLFLTKDSNSLESCHHPFTAPRPQDKQLVYSEPLSVIGQHYDLVLNGQEVGGGSIRIHDRKLQEYILKYILKEDIDSMEYFLEALSSGCPPHGGIALGIDRLMSIICNTNSIRDVMAFPKSANGRDLMAGSPAPIPNSVKQLYHLK